MSDLVLGVRVNADGSGFVGQVRQMAGANQEFTGSAHAAGAAAQQMGQGAGAATASARALAAAETSVGAAAEELARDQRQAAQATQAATAATIAHTRASNDNVRSAGQVKAGWFGVTQNLQDVGVQLSMGTDLMRVMALQGGQLATAIDQIGPGGAAGAAARFFMGPWGTALFFAGAVLEPVIANLFKQDDAQKQVTLGSNALADAQGVLGDMFDLQTGKIKNNTEALLLNARAKAINLRAEAASLEKSSTSTFQNVGSPGTAMTALGIGAIIAGAGSTEIGAGLLTGNRSARALGRAARAADRLSGEDRTRAFDQLLRMSEGVDFAGSGISKQQFQQAIIDNATARANTEIATLIDQSLDDGKLADGLKRSSKAKKPPKPKSTAALEEFGRDAADRIADILDRFDDTPPAQRQANQALRQLDDLMEDLERRKPPGFEKTIEQAKEAKVAVMDGLNRPFDDYLEAQGQQLQIQRLVNAGRVDEAEALRATIAIERQRGPLSEAQKRTILETVQGIRLQQRETEKLQRQQQMYLGTLGDIRSTIEDTIYRGPNSLAEVPARLFDSFKQLSAKDITERLFGPIFDKLEDQILGLDPMTNAAKAAAADITDLGAAARSAAAALRGEEPDIVVTGKREKSNRNTPEGLFGDAIGGILKKIGLDDEKADKIGKAAGKGLKGAFEGQAASGFLGMLGIKQSNTGAAIGGAIGSALPIPGGSIIGGLLGGTIGALFGPKPKPGGVTIGAVDGEAVQTGTSGSNSKLISQSGSLGDAVSNGLNQIVDRLGATLGNFSVSIGMYKDDYRVNENGRPLGGVKGSRAVGFDNADDAISYAISRAIAQGAVQGLSPAVAKALKSSSDVNKALEEALKVADLEKLLGGLGGQLAQIFKDFDAQASERVDLAKKYGLDLLAVEKLNAEQRVDLVNQTLKSRIGSLTDLLDNLTYGDLFEGTASERRTQILAEIDDAMADARAGVDGAADRLAELERLLVDTSKEAFGTAGPEYTGDRSSATDNIQEIIKLEQDRIAEAAGISKAQLDQIMAGNTLTNGTNDLLARANTELSGIRDALERLGAGGVLGPDLSLTAR
ncbi:hypothetical protein LZK98_08135 [Sphingomonas cannabina]|uniref:hypothetical protein n=1 Tax=Sphingomonas cannabina TaxID=2899123 RepID=UPI001F191BF9|nr:hypothetical protein [Sphingomonas cannabina]UIJ46897.1 hypothetical protein LZK98_08135 [Sphingomonas cannabina]